MIKGHGNNQQAEVALQESILKHFVFAILFMFLSGPSYGQAQKTTETLWFERAYSQLQISIEINNLIQSRTKNFLLNLYAEFSNSTYRQALAEIEKQTLEHSIPFERNTGQVMLPDHLAFMVDAEKLPDFYRYAIRGIVGMDRERINALEWGKDSSNSQAISNYADTMTHKFNLNLAYGIPIMSKFVDAEAFEVIK